MKQTDASDQRARFAAWLRQQIIKRGYDLDGTRGEHSRLARDVGVPTGSISRLLAGTNTPDIRSLRQIAPTIRTPLPELLVRAGLATKEELAGIHTRDEDGEPPMTPEHAVDRLGIIDPQERAALITMITAIQRKPPTKGGT